MSKTPMSVAGPPNQLNRRTFLLLGAGTVAAFTAACGSSTAPAAGSAPATSAPASPANAAGSPASSGASVSVSPSAPPASTPPKLADSVILGWQVAPRSIDPNSATGQAQYLYPRQVYDTLVSFDQAGNKIIPQLAVSWNRIDNTTLEFKLRDGVKFQNGDGFTAETVKANVERVIDAKNAALVGTLANIVRTIAGAETVNPTTVRIKTKSTDPYLLNRMTTIFMMPEKELANGTDFNKQAIGTGSFKITELKDNDHVTYEAWDGSWRGVSPVKHAKVVVIPELASLVAALKTGDIDILYQVSGEQIPTLKQDFNTSTSSASATSGMNMFQRGPLADKRVRQALNYAVDKQAVSQAASAGLSKPADGQTLLPSMEGYDDTLKAYPYDPDKAMALLKEAGAQNLQLALDSTTTIKAEQEATVGFLNKVGVKVGVQVLDPAVYIQHLLQKTDANMVHTQSYFWQLRTIDQAGAIFATAAQPFFANDQYKQLFIQQGQELDDAKRAGIIKQMAQIFREEAPTIQLLWVNDAHAFTKKISQLPIYYDRSVHFWEVQKAV